MKVKFDYKEDQDGFIFEGAPRHFNAVGNDTIGIGLIAHDILEHDIKKDDGSVECELMALGAAIYGRGHHGSVSQSGIMTDIISLSLDCMLELTPIKAKKFDDITWFIDGININQLKNDILTELEDYDIENISSKINNYINMALKYINKGARKAHKKYGSSFTLYNMFITLEQKLKNVLKSIDPYSEKLVVQYCIKKESVHVYTQILFDYY